MTLLVKMQKEVRSPKENLNRHRKYLNCHDQFVKRNSDTKSPDGEGLAENEEHNTGDWRRKILITEQQKAQWNCVPQLCGKQNFNG